MEENVRLMDLECLERSSVSFVHDLRSLPYSMVMSRKVRSTVARLITLLNDNYPEMAAKHIIVFGPYFLSIIMTLLQPFISPQTQEKVRHRIPPPTTPAPRNTRAHTCPS